MKRIIFDIETLDWFVKGQTRDLSKVRFGIAATCEARNYWLLRRNKWSEWERVHAPPLYHYLQSADEIVGWNIVAFDLPIIANAAMLPHEWQPRIVDMMSLIRDATNRWYKLDVIAQANLGQAKSANGEMAVTWLRSNDHRLYRRAMDYCRADVELTRRLYEKARRDGIILPPRSERGETEWLTWKLQE